MMYKGEIHTEISRSAGFAIRRQRHCKCRYSARRHCKCRRTVCEGEVRRPEKANNNSAQGNALGGTDVSRLRPARAKSFSLPSFWFVCSYSFALSGRFYCCTYVRRAMPWAGVSLPLRGVGRSLPPAPLPPFVQADMLSACMEYKDMLSDNGIANADIPHDGISNPVERRSEREQSQLLTLNFGKADE